MKTHKRYILLNSNKKVVQIISTWQKPTPLHIENYTAKLGQLQQPDGTFIDDPADVLEVDNAN